jgi:hypothetical protein
MVDTSGTVTVMSDRDDVAQVIWQTYVAETGQSLPAGLADKLAGAAIEAIERIELDATLPKAVVAAMDASPVPASTKRGTRLPEDWQPSEPVRADLMQQYPHVKLGLVLEEFRDFWCAVPGQRGLKLSWDRTFRNRVREVAHKPQYRRQGIGMRAGDQPMSKVDAKAAEYLSE